MEIKKVISANIEESQIKELALVGMATGIDNQQVHIRQALRQYIEREKAKIPKHLLPELTKRLNDYLAAK